jgi:hypothetical protein
MVRRRKKRLTRGSHQLAKSGREDDVALRKYKCGLRVNPEEKAKKKSPFERTGFLK